MGITSEGKAYANEIISKIIMNINKYHMFNLTIFFLLPIFFYEGREEINVSPIKPTVLRTRLAVSSLVKALAEIFDFAAGLMQRVPKKTSIAKSDLQNSTAD